VIAHLQDVFPLSSLYDYDVAQDLQWNFGAAADRTGLGANRKTPERRVASVLSVSEAAKDGCKRYSVVGWGRMVSGAVGARVERVRVRWCTVGRL
jgi:hypothetical protein